MKLLKMGVKLTRAYRLFSGFYSSMQNGWEICLSMRQFCQRGENICFKTPVQTKTIFHTIHSQCKTKPQKSHLVQTIIKKLLEYRKSMNFYYEYDACGIHQQPRHVKISQISLKTFDNQHIELLNQVLKLLMSPKLRAENMSFQRERKLFSESYHS